MNRKTVSSAFALTVFFAFVGLSHAKLPKEDVIEVPAIGEGLCVSNVFQTNMVIQRDKPIAIWGWASPGEKVTVSFNGDDASATAAADRSWKVTLAAKAASSNPAELTVKGAERSITLTNVLVGDVWVLGGQSNMEFPLSKVENGALEIVSANFPEIRILTVPGQNGADLKKGFPRLHEWSSWFGRHFRKGDWDICTPEIVSELSAIGYVFARRVHKAAGVPIGVIDTSRGGTTVETWTPEPILRKMENVPLKAKLVEWDQKLAEWDSQKDLASRIKRHHDWVAKMVKEEKPIPADRVEPTDLQPGPAMDQNRPGNCFASMIGPMVGLSIKGAIFHQGYNNAFDGSAGVAMYRDVFPSMITAWRDAFGDPAMPFGILSLCTDGNPQTRDDYLEKMFNAGIDLRAAQYQTFLDFHKAGDANIGFVSTYDLRRRWYHPQLKAPAGERIARWALATQYGFEKQIQWKPPILLGMERVDGTLVLELDSDVGDPQDGAIEGFAIAGEDRRFQPVTASYSITGKDDRGRPKLNRKKLVLSSPLVAEPVHFRYAWGRNPLANLQATGNKDIPFATQRSDDWKLEEVPLGVFKEELTDKLSRQQRSQIINELKMGDTRRRLLEAEQFIEANKASFEAAVEKMKEKAAEIEKN
ncbi:MAG: sialate O-acetylesterase [Pseudoalteromonas tetraodonis]|jgi:sialate O-acetylesterase